MCLVLISHSMRVADSLVFNLATIQYCLPLVTAMPRRSSATSRAQQVPYLGTLYTTQVWRAFPGKRLLSAFRLSTNELGDPVLCSTAMEICVTSALKVGVNGIATHCSWMPESGPATSQAALSTYKSFLIPRLL